MANGIQEKSIKKRGVALVLTIEGKKYPLNPSPTDMLRMSKRLAEIADKLEREGTTDDKGKKVKREMSSDDQADVADLLFEYCSGEHFNYFRSLSTEMQGDIVNEMWVWYSKLDLPKIGADPTNGS